MTPVERAFWLRVQRRASGLSPELATAILRAFKIIRDSVSEAELVRLISSGNVDQLLTTALSASAIERAFLPVREKIRNSVADSVKYLARELPKAGRVDGVLSVGFDILNPRVIDAVRELDTKVITTLADDARATVRAATEAGLRDGISPRTVARNLRDVIGLAPNQEQAIRNFRTLLENGDREALTRALRDRRFDGTLQKAFGADGNGLAADQTDRMVDAYRKRMIAYNADTNARTAALDSQKLGQRLSWQDAIDKGIVDGDRAMKRWVGVKDDRERPEHLAMEGEEVPFDQPFSNGEMVPGDSTYNCRCVAAYFQAKQ